MVGMEKPIAESLVKTCDSCPAQWSGKTADKQDLYIRYRWGRLTAHVNGREIYSQNIGHDLSGCMETLEMVLILSQVIDFSHVQESVGA